MSLKIRILVSVYFFNLLALLSFASPDPHFFLGQTKF